MKAKVNEEKRTPLNVDDHRKRLKDHDLRICTWNVRTLLRPGASIQLADVLDEYKADITAIQEIRWKGHGVNKVKNCDIYYSCHDNKHHFGCGFVVNKRIRHLVAGFTPVDEWLATLRIKAKFFYISLICAHAPTEDKDEETKDTFYERLEQTYDRCPGHDIKIVLGDFNAKVGREGIFGPTVGKFSLHDDTSDNGMRLIDFAAARNMVISSTRFKHRNIHNATWLSPDGKTKNQIDHVVIDSRHASSVLDVRTFRAANIDSDHYLVAAKVRTRISSEKRVRNNNKRKLDVEKLHTQQTAEAFSTKLSQLLLAKTPPPDDISAQWQHILDSLTRAAEEEIGYRKRPERNQWYDEECRAATEAKNVAYKATLAPMATRAVLDRYRALRREEHRLFREKKKELERRECEEIEIYGNRNDARKFYQRVKNQTKDASIGIASCRDKNGNLVTDTSSMLSIWKEHFSNLLAAAVSSDESSPQPIIDDGVECTPPTQQEVQTAISRLKNNKAAGADGVPAELYKTGGDELIRCMHQLVCTIWKNERMPDDWNLSVLCPIHKKGDKTVCANYRGISLLSIAYKVLSSILCERLKPKLADLIQPYQCGFRPNKSTIDQIFTLRQILEQTHEKQIDTYHLFIDYKAAFDTPIRERLFETMSAYGIPAKLIRLCRMTLSDTKSSVKIGSDLSEPFTTTRGLRQGDSLSCNFFNILMEKILENSKVNKTGTINTKSHILLAYADDIDIVGRTERDVTGAFSRIERESSKMGLVVNEDKTKMMLATAREAPRRKKGEIVPAGSCNVEVVEDFVYLGSAINQKNDVSTEIKRRVVLANRCYFGLGKQLKNRALSRKTKITLYNTLILPVLLYGAETWVLAKADEAVLGVFERKILRKIYGPICVNEEYRRRTNHELYELYPDINVVKRIKLQRLRWLGHVGRMETNAPARKALDDKYHGKRRQGRPRLRWKDQVEEDVRILGIRNWRQHAQDRSAWRSFIQQAKTNNRL